MTVGVGIYTGGDPYTSGVSYPGSPVQQLFADISQGVYNSVVIWAAHVNSSGDIAINDSQVVSGGVFNADAAPWAAQVSGLKDGTTITRLELSIGGDSTSFANIKSLINQYGTGSGNPLYGNLQVLQQELLLDAVNYDDESEYDQSSSAALATICVELGMNVSLCPYTYESYWVGLTNAVNGANPGTVDAVYLQCYDGGAGNDPSTWNGYFQGTGLTIAPGLWATHQTGNPPVCTSSTTSSQAQSQMASWAAGTSLDGGWMFVGTDMQKCPNGGTPQDYAQAICTGLGYSNCSG